jgi:hypothetical protein
MTEISDELRTLARRYTSAKQNGNLDELPAIEAEAGSQGLDGDLRKLVKDQEVREAIFDACNAYTEGDGLFWLMEPVHDRLAAWAEKAVRQSKAATAEEAKKIAADALEGLGDNPTDVLNTLFSEDGDEALHEHLRKIVGEKEWNEIQKSVQMLTDLNTDSPRN